MQAARFTGQKAIARHLINAAMKAGIDLVIFLGVISRNRRAAGFIILFQRINIFGGGAACGKPDGHTFQLGHHFKHFNKLAKAWRANKGATARQMFGKAGFG